MKENYFKSLTGLRFVAASIVFFHHFNPFNTEKLPGGIFNEFHSGVTLFFVLSGFLISYRYGGREIDYKKYFVKRFARIYPVYFIFTALTYAIHPKDLVEVFMNFTLLKSFFADYLFTGVSQGWTLTVEESFYAFALLLFLLRKYKLYLLIAIIPAALLIIGLGLQNFFSNHDIRGFLSTNDLITSFSFFGRSLEFISGFLLGAFINKIKSDFKYFTYIGISMIVIMWFAMFILRDGAIISMYTFSGKIINNVFLPLFGIIPLIIGLVKEKTFVSKFLEFDFIEYLGKSSYAFYIIHMGILSEFLFGIIGNTLIVYFITLVVSCFVYKFVEQPANVFCKRILNKS